jgi:hypothetical protein
MRHTLLYVQERRVKLFRKRHWRPVRLSDLRISRALVRRNIFISASVNHLCLWISKPQGRARQERLGKLITFNNVIGSRTRDLTACSIVPPPKYTREQLHIDTVESCLQRRIVHFRKKERRQFHEGRESRPPRYALPRAASANTHVAVTLTHAVT